MLNIFILSSKKTRIKNKLSVIEKKRNIVLKLLKNIPRDNNLINKDKSEINILFALFERWEILHKKVKTKLERGYQIKNIYKYDLQLLESMLVSIEEKCYEISNRYIT